ncbi:rhodanese-like domain-containing protein [Flavobacterium sp. F372]|jgi:phage shock protein E|uniref:Rhodanese-like domain-containing protein n=1 Tax=Flavobacterium bernardetii TaxID=2813823 RepID=A0ABR7IYB9_9FLAO|nr:rhodanese-like domain-containing protein [Flavobacterium bernardetii]MBC5834542.1 rhodanese-like domain-containing protein [Flavobacterium bernardetii]NHF70190.1 rhodanese-like domain-containing protein [Flavobacterium bernardetii]
MGILDFFGFGDKSNQISEFIERDAVIIDVRSYEEFAGGHIQNSKNIPLQIIESKITDIKKLNKAVIVCCKSGMRSAQANSILKRNGIETINGGGWQSLQNKL